MSIKFPALYQDENDTIHFYVLDNEFKLAATGGARLGEPVAVVSEAPAAVEIIEAATAPEDFSTPPLVLRGAWQVSWLHLPTRTLAGEPYIYSVHEVDAAKKHVSQTSRAKPRRGGALTSCISMFSYGKGKGDMSTPRQHLKFRK